MNGLRSALERVLAAALLVGLVFLAWSALAGRDAPAAGPAAGPAPLEPSRPALEGGSAPADAPGSSAPAPAPAVARFNRSADHVLQDGELVLGPAAAGFDTAAFLAERGSALAAHRESIRQTQRRAGEVVDMVAQQHSLSPKLLLALLDLDTGWVSGPATSGVPSGVFDRLAVAAVWLADGYYGAKYRGETDAIHADGSRTPIGLASGAGHLAVARYLARGTRAADLPARLAAFAATYDRLFGPAPVLAPPIGPAGVRQPPLLLPWPEGERWYFTGGPHGAWGVATAWGALDFAPPSRVGCAAAPEWTVAAAPGIVTWSDDGLVLVDLDGDGFSGTGWVVAYLHMATQGRVPAGRVVAAGDPIGHPSCEGGVADGAHVHLARRYNGEWLPADGGPAPLDLSGWTFTSYGREYDGSMQHPSLGNRVAVVSRRPGESELASDNGPPRRAELAAAWTEAVRADVAQREPGAAAAASSVGPAAAGTPSTGPSIVAAPAAVTAPPLPDGATLRLRLALEGRSNHATPLVIGLVRDDLPPAVLLAEAGAGGDTGPIALPSSIVGTYDLTVRAPGFLPAPARGVRLGAGAVVVDLTAGGLLTLSAGELNLDEAIGPGDLAAWLGLWWRDNPAADLNGDGRITPADVWPALRNAGAARH